MYWAVTTTLTVGYGDIIPKNPNERLFNIFVMIVGCGIFAFSMNSIADVIATVT